MGKEASDKGDRTKHGYQAVPSSDVTKLQRGEPPQPGTSEPSEIDQVIKHYRDRQRPPSAEENPRPLGEDRPNAPKPIDKSKRQEWVERLKPSYHTLRIKHEYETTRHYLITELRRELDNLATQMIQKDPTLKQEIRQIAMRTEQKVWDGLKPKVNNAPLAIKMAITALREPSQTSSRTILKHLMDATKTDDGSTVKREIRFQPTENQQKFMDQFVKQLAQDAPTAAHNDSGESDFTVKQWGMLDKISKRLYQEVSQISEEDPHNEDLRIKAEIQALQILKHIRSTSYEPYYNGAEGGFESQLKSTYDSRRPNDGPADKHRSETQHSEDTIRTRLEAVLGEALDLEPPTNPFGDEYAIPELDPFGDEHLGLALAASSTGRPSEPPLRHTPSFSSDSSSSLHSESSDSESSDSGSLTNHFGDEHLDLELAASGTRRSPEPPRRRTPSVSSDSSNSLHPEPSDSESSTDPFGDV